MDNNEIVTPDGPIAGDVAAVIKDVLYAQIPIVIAIGMYVEDDEVASALVGALAEVVTAITEKAEAGGYTIKRNYEAWSKEDLLERDMAYMPYGRHHD